MGIENVTATSVEGLSPDDKKVLRKAVQELNDSLTRVSAERELQKEIINEVNDKIGVDKKLVRRLANAYFKANFKDEVEKNEEFEMFYEMVIERTAD